MNVIEFNNVTKVYKLYKDNRRKLLGLLLKNIEYTEKYANKDVSFAIAEGESIALFGRNGAGKSTLLKLVTGVVYPTSGTVTVTGRVSALLELTAGFDQEFTGRENLHLKCRLQGMSQDEVDVIEQDIIDFSELGEYIDQPVRTYSTGMKSRLGFSISIHVDPDILVIDEALSVGDQKFNEKCKNKVQEVLKNSKLTVLYVTHSVQSAKEFCTRGMVISEGELVHVGEIDEAVAVYQKLLE